METNSENAPSTLAKVTIQQLTAVVKRLERRHQELRRFRTQVDRIGYSKFMALERSINQALEEIFGRRTEAYYRFKVGSDFDDLFDERKTLPVLQSEIFKRKQQDLIILGEAIRCLKEQLEFREGEVPADAPLEKGSLVSGKVFVVHGHDQGAKESVARFLEQLGLEVIILHEQPNSGKTVIEKFESYSDVGFAVVLLTPDDETVSGGKRARQNVILELGYFIGSLGRGKVCALRKGDVEVPSDILGVLWTDFDDNSDWRISLGQELQAAGHSIDWNKVMRPKP